MPPAEAMGRIGPNAITQVADVLSARHGREFSRQLFAKAGLSRHFAHPPTQMVDEDEVTQLHAALHHCLEDEEAARVSAVAGRRTAEYLLANRIPKGAQWLLKLLPKTLAARIFTRSIGRHAWTFAGSGYFSAAREAGGLLLCLHDNPACRELATGVPSCHYFTATFETLYRAILGPSVRVAEVACEAAGDDCCCFRVSWGRPRAARPPTLSDLPVRPAARARVRLR